MKLSIITVNLNNKSGLQKTINSVVNQTCHNFEWIIIDGGSIDGSKELIEKYYSNFDYCVSEKDEGIYDAMNKGIKASHGKYLLFLNSGDCLYEKNVIKKILPNLKEKDFYIGFEISEKGIIKLKCSNKEYVKYYLINYSIPHQASFIKKETLEKLGYYDNKVNIIADWWFAVNALVLNKYNIELFHFPICYYDINGISTSKSNIVISERIRLLTKINLKGRLKLYFLIYKFRISLIPIKIKIYNFLLLFKCN